MRTSFRYSVDETSFLQQQHDLIYPKFKTTTKLFETDGEVDPSEYEDRRCDIKAVLKIGGILVNGEKTSLQLKLYEALVKEHVYEHVRLVDMEW